MLIKETNLQACMRDGVMLCCDVYRPDDGAPHPAVVMRTPYGKQNIGDGWLYADYEALAGSGYCVVVQDVRGTSESGGELLSHGGLEARDGYDTIEWIAAQPWCDGNVGMYGLSYFGYTQMAAASMNPPHLKAICPFQNGALTPFSITKQRTFGCYHLRWLYGQLLGRLDKMPLTEDDKQTIRARVEDYSSRWSQVMLSLPADSTEAAMIPGAPLLSDYPALVRGVEDPAYWKAANRPIPVEKIDVPMLFLTGWFDGAKDGTLENYDEVALRGNRSAFQNSRLVIGPWTHGGNLGRTIDDIDFGEAASGEAQDIRGLMRRWFDRWLKGLPQADEPPVRLFLLGQNEWVTEAQWPPKRAREQAWMLTGTKADGRLERGCSAQAYREEYLYDPASHFPSDTTDAQGRGLTADPSAQEARDDLLVFRSQPLEEDLRAEGYVKLRLYAASDAVDTDFFARLSVILTSGRVVPLTHGIIRARYRSGLEARMLTPGHTECYQINLGGIGIVFKRGQRIRLEITSSFYPMHDRNLNSGERIGCGTVCKTARQTIIGSAVCPSALLLPVISPACGCDDAQKEASHAQ